jgi:site-specific DNA recombinase
MRKEAMIAAVYARTSQDNNDNFSTQRQIKDALEYASRMGLTVYEEYIFEEDYTGAKLDRPELDKLHALIKSGKIKHLIIWKVDRLSRVKHHAQWILGEWLIPNNVTLHVVDKNTTIKDEISGKIMFDVDANIAEEERHNIMKRTANGRKEKVEQGYYLGQGYTPYGFIKEGTRYKTRLYINEEEAKVVRSIYDMYVTERLNAKEIARRLAAAGIPSPSEARKRLWSMTHWKADAVRTILRDPRYIGTFYQFRNERKNGLNKARPKEEWVKTLFPELAIVDMDVFNAAQEILTSHRDKWTFRSTNQYLMMGGRTRCVCGSSITSRTARSHGKYEYPMYVCAKKHAEGKECVFPTVRSSLADAIIWDEVEYLIRNPEITIDSLQQAQASQKEQHTNTLMTLEAIEGVRADYETSLAKYYQDYEDGLLSRALYKAKKDDLDKRLEVAEELHKEYLERMKDKVLTDKDIERMIKECTKLSEVLDEIGSLEFEHKRHIIELLNIRGKYEIEIIDDIEMIVLYLYMHNIPIFEDATIIRPLHLSHGKDNSRSSPEYTARPSRQWAPPGRWRGR